MSSDEGELPECEMGYPGYTPMSFSRDRVPMSSVIKSSSRYIEKPKTSSVGVSVIACPMEPCEKKTKTEEEMQKHVEYHTGERKFDIDENKEDSNAESTNASRKKMKIQNEENEESYDSNEKTNAQESKQKGTSKVTKNINKPKSRSGGKKSLVPFGDDLISYQGHKIKFRLIVLQGEVETVEKNLLDYVNGNARVKWDRSLVYEWLRNEVPESMDWPKETLKRRTKEIEQHADKFIMTKTESKKTGAGDFDKDLDPMLRSERDENYVEPKTQEERNVAELRKKFKDLKESLDVAQPPVSNKEVNPNLAAKASAVGDMLDNVSKNETDEIPSSGTRRLRGTLDGRSSDLYDKSRDRRINSVRNNANKKEKRNQNNFGDGVGLEDRVGRLVDLAEQRLETPQAMQTPQGSN